MTSPNPPSGQRLLDGRYRLEVPLGSGGVAEVFRAFDERLHRDVAVKLFRGDVADQLQRHEEEMRTLARLDHPSLVTVLDAGTDDETHRPYLVMALVEGPTLADELRFGPLPTTRVAEIGAALADALSYVHSQGLVHRDVKPANVLISADGRVHLADFGIARLVDSSHLTSAGEVVGTPAYFAPEQVTGEPVGPPSDVYALGLLLLECLTGRREYEGAPLEVAMARITTPPAIPPSLPVGWRDLLGGMTARLAGARLSAAQAADRLRRLAVDSADATVAMTPPVAAPPTVAMPAPTALLPPIAEPIASPDAAAGTSRRAWPWVLGILLVLAAIIAVAIVLSRNSSPQANGPAANCAAGIPVLTGKVEADLTNLTGLVCNGNVSRKASDALSPYLSQLGTAVQNKDVATLDATTTAMSNEIGRQQQLGHLTSQQSQSIGDALTLFHSDAVRRLTRPKPSSSASPSNSPSVSPSQSTTPPPTTAPPTTTPSMTPSPTPSSSLTLF
jgi:serine/threonine protein kinase